MNFTEWLGQQAETNSDVDLFIRDAIEDKSWPDESNNLRAFVQHIKIKGATVDICGNLLKFWAKYLKVVSTMRPITAEEIREIREVLMGMLGWIRSNSSDLNTFEQEALSEAESQVACLEEKEVELRYINKRLNRKG